MKEKGPPKLALRFLEWFCPPALYEGIEGDLRESFEADVEEFSVRKARRKFVWNVLRFFRPAIILRNNFRFKLFNTIMLKNYTTVAFRSLWRSKGHSFINITGLSLGIACCILIALFVKDEWTFDTFHTKANRIYRAYVKEDHGENQQFFNTITPFPLGPVLKENFSQIEAQVRISTVSSVVDVGTSRFAETLTITGQDFFSVFDFPVMQGDAKKALQDRSGVIITEQIAHKYFGESDPVNKTITLHFTEKPEDFFVKAVVKNPPANSSIQFDLIVSDLILPSLYNEHMLTAGWFSVIPETYILLREGEDAQALQQKFPPVFRASLGDENFNESKYAVGLQPITEIHLNTEFPAGMAPVSNPRYAYILSAVAILILSVACINFITLSVGRSVKRAREVGIRKAVGAVPRQLVVQFTGEALIVTLISMISGTLITLICLPVFNQLSGKSLSLTLDAFLVYTALILVLVIGLIAGSYPAFVLSAFKPIAVLKGSLAGISNKQTFRKALVGIQLVLSVFLVSSTLIMQQQLTFLQTKNLGFSKEQLVVLQLNAARSGNLMEKIKSGFEKVQLFRNEFTHVPGVASVCGSSHDFGNGSWTNVGYTDDKGTYRTFFMNVVDPDFFPVMKLELASGRSFDIANPADVHGGVVVNEAFVREIGWKQPIGQRIPGKNFAAHEVIGVVKDFNYSSLYTRVEPLVMVVDPHIIAPGIENLYFENSPIPKIIVRLKPGDIPTTINQVEGVWEKLTDGEEFNFSFVDQTLAAQYKSDQNLGRIISIATLLAIVIGSLGLYGLASLSMQNRTKEISIRKVLGAPQRSLLMLLSKEYLFLVGISLVLSVPITWYLMVEWLRSFEYRIDIGWTHFAFAGLLSLFVAMLTISYQTIKTASAQPADTLKYE
ncbi:MAG: ABC transporter permease [Cyclobacteriaceae bacterium]|nr:ABC transporter permease [Cyclobacteriaceae bacterium]